MADPTIFICEPFRGSITATDLLQSKGTLMFHTDPASIKRGGFIFSVSGDGFTFAFSFQNSSMVVQRNDVMSVLTLEHLLSEPRLIVTLLWSHSELKLICGIGNNARTAEIPTKPEAPPVTLVKWARLNALTRVTQFDSVEQFRSRVHEALVEINRKIHEADAYKSFWNISYNGQKIVGRHPKTEVEIQPLVRCLMSDQMLLSGIEILAEPHDGSGDLDFAFLSSIKGNGIARLCAEFKLAHSQDLAHGLNTQLPLYMRSHGATYGVYCVLNFKGDWFDEPKTPPDIGVEVYVEGLKRLNPQPEHSNIRIFCFNLAKPATASKAAG